MNSKKIGLKEAISIGIGGMVGGGIFAVVNYVGFKLAKDINGEKSIPLIGFLLCAIATVTLIVQQYPSNKRGVLIALIIILICFIIEYIYKNTEK